MTSRQSGQLLLNPQQKQAVEHTQGPLLIIAGAGTGKTTVITEKIKYLVTQKKVRPEEILALTFTERAAQEMEERVDMALPLGYTQTWISTFHSFCERILRQEALQIGLSPDFVILSQAEAYLFAKEHLFEFNLKYFKPLGNPTKFISGMLTHFDRLRDEEVVPSAYLRWAKAQSSKLKAQNHNLKLKSEEINKFLELAKACKRYEKLKTQYNVMDFADLITYTLRLFHQRPSVLKKYQQQFKYILIDEFQDTNYVQNHLAILLAGDNQNITVVADDDQAIYRWRGAAVYNVLDFRKHFPQAQIITLTENYRSQQEILDRAYELIQRNNPNRLEVREKLDKKLKSRVGLSQQQGAVKVVFEARVEDEAEGVAAEISQLISANPKSEIRNPKQIRNPKFKVEDKAGFASDELRITSYQPKDIAILVRANNHAQPFVQALARRGIPHQFLGPGKLYQKPEIKDLIAYLQVLDNFDNDVAMYRVLVMPWLGINRRDVAKLVNLARKHNLSLFEEMEKLVQGHQGNSSPAANRGTVPPKFQKLTALIHRHLDLVPDESPGQILYYFVQEIGLLQRLGAPRSDFEERQALNISRFFDKIKAFETQNPEARVSNLVEYLDFVVSAGESPLASEIDWSGENAVNIITLHSAKGLEFPVIFLVNLVSERFPTRNRRDQIPLPEELIHEPLPPGDLHEQEERRLFYVGLTRAKEKLYLTGAKFYGEAKRPKKLSPFVFETLGEKLEPYLLTERAASSGLFTQEGTALRAPRQKAGKQGSRLNKEQARSSTLSPEPRTVQYLSYSQINTFEICPLHYKLKYLLRIPTLPSAAVSFGRSLHETLRQFYQSLKDGNGGIEPSIRSLLILYRQNWISEGYLSKEHEEERRQQGRQYLRDFFEQEFNLQAKVLVMEEPFVFKIKELKIGGRIDRIDRLPDGGIEIIDYKTGQLQEDKFLKKDLQLSIYALAASAVRADWQEKLDKISLSYYYFEEGTKKTLQRSGQDLVEAREQLLEIKGQIEQSDFTCSCNLICQRGCEYALFCNTEE